MSTVALAPGFARPRTAQRPTRDSRAGAAAPVASAPAGGAVRLTRRGRLVLTTSFLVALLAVFTAFGATSVATDDAGEPVPTRTVMVGEGDTLWGIASEVAAPGETRAVMHEIQQLNALSSSGVALGQELAIPIAD